MTSFLDLPGEIRSQIYTHVARTGRLALALFSTSKRIRQEGAPISSQYITFRIKNPIPVPLEATPLIQHSSLQINLTSEQRGIEYLSGSRIAREYCRILLFWPGFTMDRPRSGEYAVVPAIKKLVGIQSLSLVLRGNVDFKAFVADYQELEKELAPSLGPGVCKCCCCDDRVREQHWAGVYYLVFQPYSFSKEDLPHPEVSKHGTTTAI